MDKAALFVWSIVFGMSVMAFKRTESAWTVAAMALSIMMLVALMYMEVKK